MLRLSSKQRIAVLGGGAAGVAAAGQLSRAFGIQVDLFEAAPILGGLHKSATLEGETYDVGAFVFSTEHALLQVFPELSSMFVGLDARFRRLTPSGALDHYPISIRGYLREVGLGRASLAAIDMLSSKIIHRHPDTVAAYAYSHMGRRIYESSGLRAYVERLYSRPDSEIDLQFALQRLRYLGEISITRSLTTGLQRVIRRSDDGSTQRVLIRPPAGFSACYNRIRELLESSGVRVFTSSSPRALLSLGNGAFEMESEQGKQRYDSLIATIPLTQTLSLLGRVGRGRYEHVTLVTLFYRGQLLMEGDFIYNFTHDGAWKRISVFSRMYRETSGAERFGVEIAVRDGEPFDVTLLQVEFESHAARMGLLAHPERVGSCVTEHAYPVFLKGQYGEVLKDRAEAEALGIHLTGRQGLFAYFSSAESAAHARKTADATAKMIS